MAITLYLLGGWAISIIILSLVFTFLHARGTINWWNDEKAFLLFLWPIVVVSLPIFLAFMAPWFLAEWLGKRTGSRP